MDGIQHSQDYFNEADYLKLNPDVAIAVNDGRFASGNEHYNKHGKSEGRKCYIFKPRSSEGILNMVDVPEQFRPIQSIEYPQGNSIPFERYFYNYFIENKPFTTRIYLPVFWTSVYVNNGYKSIPDLQKYINGLDRGKKYFTVCQYDDQILDNISGLDILIYASGSNKHGGYPIPLLAFPTNAMPFELTKKDINYSFIGANTHSIREKLVKKLGNNYVTFDNKCHDEYIDILRRSTFNLCPRGYGITSFRMYEGLAFGCIPVYISDDGYWEAFNVPFEYGLKVNSKDLSNIKSILSNVDVNAMQSKVEEFYKAYCVYSSCCDKLVKTLQ